MIRLRDKYLQEAYDEGYQAAKDGLDETENPWELSGHERDTTYQDEMHYAWYSGWEDYNFNETT